MLEGAKDILLLALLTFYSTTLIMIEKYFNYLTIRVSITLHSNYLSVIEMLSFSILWTITICSIVSIAAAESANSTTPLYAVEINLFGLYISSTSVIVLGKKL